MPDSVSWSSIAATTPITIAADMPATTPTPNARPTVASRRRPGVEHGRLPGAGITKEQHLHAQAAIQLGGRRRVEHVAVRGRRRDVVQGIGYRAGPADDGDVEILHDAGRGPELPHVREQVPAGLSGQRLRLVVRRRVAPARRQLDERLEENEFQVRRTHDRRDREVGVLEQPAAKRDLLVAVRVRQGRRRQGRGAFADQEDQPLETERGRLLELQLRVGQLGLTPHLRAVAVADDPDVDVGQRHLPATVVGGGRIASGEVRHVSQGVSSSKHRGLGRSHERAINGMFSEF
jgi:hypothetical protein